MHEDNAIMVSATKSLAESPTMCVYNDYLLITGPTANHVCLLRHFKRLSVTCPVLVACIYERLECSYNLHNG